MLRSNKTFVARPLVRLAAAIVLAMACIALCCEEAYALPEEQAEVAQGDVEKAPEDPAAYAAWKESLTREASEDDGEGLSTQSTDPGYIQNDYIQCYVQSNGLFNIGTSDGANLLYEFPSGKTSRTLVRIDGEEYWFDDYVDETVIYGSTATSTAHIDGLTVTQVLAVGKSPNSKSDNVINITYQCSTKDDFGTNDPSAHDFGMRRVAVRIMLDTMLGTNDGAPFLVKDKPVTTETEYIGSNVPNHYQAVESLDEAGLVATGYTSQMTPAKLQLAAWTEIDESGWDYKIDKGRSITGDSAVALYFDEVMVGDVTKTVAKTCYGAYSSLMGVTDTTFNYSNHMLEKELAIQSAKYASLSYGKYRYDGVRDLFFEENGHDTTEYLVRTLSLDSFHNIDTDNCKSPKKQTEDDEDGATFVLAHKKVLRNGALRDLLLVVIRGTNGIEWKGNMNVTGRSYQSNSIHQSFLEGANRTRAKIDEYIRARKDSENALDRISNPIVLVCGHSRGGAIGNILARQLSEGLLDSVDSSAVFGYFFATPNTDMHADTGMDNIYNFCFSDDFVPNMPFTFWGYAKNGRTYVANATVQPKSGGFYTAETTSVNLSYGREPSFDQAQLEKIVEYVKTKKKVDGNYAWPDIRGYYQTYRLEERSFYEFMHDLVAPAAMPYASLIVDQVPLAICANDKISHYRTIAKYFVDGTHTRYSVNDTHQMYTYYNALTRGVKFSSGGQSIIVKEEPEDGLVALETQEATSDDVLGVEAQEVEAIDADGLDVEAQESDGADELDALRNIIIANADAFEAAGWDSENVATWNGVKFVDGHVSELNLDALGVAGELDCTMFPYLQRLQVDDNEITALTLPTQGTLTWLSCADNKLTSLSFEGVSLTFLDCTRNFLDEAAMETVAQNIEFASVGSQKIPDGATFDSGDISVLAGSGVARDLGWDEAQNPDTWDGVVWGNVNGTYHVVRIELNNHGLGGNLNVSGLGYLESLSCANNRLTSLLATSCPKLAFLNCSNNCIVSLSVDSGLAMLYCSENMLTPHDLDSLGVNPTYATHQRVDASAHPFDGDEVALIQSLTTADGYALSDDYSEWEFVDWILANDGSYHARHLDLSGFEINGSLDLSKFVSLMSLNCSGTGVKDVTLPASLTAIPDYAFYDCSDLAYVVLPAGVQSIGTSAFANCSNLEAACFTGNAPALAEDVFVGCTGGFTIYHLEGTTGWDGASYEDYLMEETGPLSVLSLPDTIEYYIDSDLDTTGLELFQVSTDGTHSVITDGFVCDPDHFEEEGYRTVTVSYGEHATQFDVHVSTCKMEDCWASITGGSIQTYTGAPITPEIVVYDEFYRKVDASNYSVSYKDNVETGRASITIDGRGKYTGSLVLTFRIVGTKRVSDWHDLQSLHPYVSDSDFNWVFTTKVAANHGLQLTFSPSCSLENNYDYLSIYDGKDTLVGQYTGAELANKSITVPGGTVKIHLESDYSQTDWGFGVTNLKVVDLRTNISQCAINVPSSPYSGAAQTARVIVRHGNKTLVQGTDFTVSGGKGTIVGTYTVTINGTGAYKGKVAKSFVITQAPNAMIVKAKKVALKLGALKSTAQSIKAKKAYTVSGANGKVTYKLKSIDKKKFKKYFKVAKSGKITAKKGLPKGTYKLKVAVSAAGDKNHKAATKTVTVKVTVK